MSRTALRDFQKAAVLSGVSLFSDCKKFLDVAGDDAGGRAAAISQHGTLLFEAPTGAGKTLIAGHLVEEFSKVDDVVWFWFAPFKGVTGQTSSSLRAEFPGIRVRELSEDRHSDDSKTGDVFVTTWQTVATRVKDSRNVHKPGEKNLTFEELIAAIRSQKLRIGVVVDEAHHGFFGANNETQAMKFFRESLRPEYTIFITATPDDADIERFKEKLQVQLNRQTIGRREPTEDGLIKLGVKCVAYFAQPGQETLVDYEDIALRDGVALHQKIKAELKNIGVDLIPLMLVQVDSAGKSVDRAKEKLLAMGFTDSQIAIHTAEEPDASLLALANDEHREVLIFKMAVALGFDAPRAFTLVSMRAARDEDFGVQLVGRILRVHRRLQGRARAKTLPELLRYGCVLLADAQSQSGLDTAGQRINRLQTEYSKVASTLTTVCIGGRFYVQQPDADGQLRMIQLPPPATAPGIPVAMPPADDLFTSAPKPEIPTVSPILSFFDPPPPVVGADEAAGPEENKASISFAPRKYSYTLRADVPRQFKTQRVSPDNEATEEECANKFMISSQEMLRALAAKISVDKKTVEIFTHQVQLELAQAPLDPDQAARAAIKALHKYDDIFDARELRRSLLRKLKSVMLEIGLENATDDDHVSHMLNVILSGNPQLLYDAQKEALAANCIVENADDELPAKLESDSALVTSRLNVYRVIPPGLNAWETEFAGLLDRDQLEVISWWHRNEPHKPWSVQVVLSNGVPFFPDFVIGIEGRKRWERTLLADPKYYFESSAELPKSHAAHPAYGRVLILSKHGPQWMTIRYDEKNHRAVLDREFRIADTAGY